MKTRRETVALLGILLVLGLAGGAAAAAVSGKPNFVHIVLDEWGYYESSHMGHPILQTPNIDRIAREGMRFTQALAGGNVCAPTRCTLMTGKHTGHCSVRINPGGTPIREDDVTIAQVLRQAGYASGGFGKWGLGDRGTTGVPEKHGFDLFFGYYHQVHAHSFFPNYLLRNSEKVPLAGNTGDFQQGQTFSQYLIYQEALKFIRAHKDRPFYAYLPWTPPHGRWGLPEDEPAWQKYKGKQWDTDQKDSQNAQMYAAMVEMDDRQIGDVLNLLKELGLDDRTLILVSGDNGGLEYFRNERHPDGLFAPNRDPRTGLRFRGGKGNFYEGGLRVNFLVRWREKIKAGAVSDQLCYFPDVMPTFAELAGASPPADSDGISLVPTLLGEDVVGRKQPQHEYLYWEDAKSAAVRMGSWKAIRSKKSDDWELYDLSKDIEETKNVAQQHPDILAKMTAYAQAAHQPVREGTVLDASLGFRDHKSK
jgi:arylsulfatase A-like enzyme